MKNLFVLSLGGSLMVPEEIDTQFLKQFKKLIEAEIRRGKRFIIITGGGKVCRKYQTALRTVTRPSAESLDWMGIYTTRLNARLMQLMFGTLAHPNIVEDTNKKLPFREKILLAGGWIPGRSTDDDAVRMAHAYGAPTLINLSNIDFIYTKDPKKFPNARPVRGFSWPEYRRMVGDKWTPGANFPFDPVAAQFAQKHRLKVIVANGKKLANLKKILEGKKFIGTEIH